MKVPLSWLREYVEVDATPQEIAEKLTFSGIEVEGIDTIGAGLDDIIVGEVLSIAPHPGADRLRLCRVSNGQEELPIVCGADNFAEGARVALAPVGATLPDGMKIKKAKIRGEISLGMLCAEDELGLSDDHAGIMILPPDAIPGTPLRDVIGPEETVLELEITWNRADCLSILGIAREIGALFNLPVKRPEPSLTESDTPVEELASVCVENPTACPRYTARVLSDVAIGPSPEWMQKRLLLAGVRPISNVVDITNYVMLECGHPLHAFDYDLLADHQIIVRNATPGETIHTLDDIERTLDDKMLVIADTKQPVAVAGVMGGAGTEIGERVTRVLLESATFAPDLTHRTSSVLGLTSESSHRFERSVDAMTVEWASQRAAALMAEYAGATVAKGVIDIFPEPPPERTIICRTKRISDVMGTDIPRETIFAILKSLDIPVSQDSDDSFTVTAPGFRTDLEIEADVIEEVVRMYGLDKVPARAPSADIVLDADDTRPRAVVQCRENLAGLGLSEIMNYSFLSDQLLDAFNPDRTERVVLPNPVSADHSTLRPSLIPQMVESLGRNHSRFVADAAFFEIGRVFVKDGETISENEKISIGLMGKIGRAHLDQMRPVENEEMFLWVKGVLESLATQQHAGPITLAPADHPSLQPGYAFTVNISDKPIGIIGLVSDTIRKRWRITEPVGVAEVDIDPMLTDAFAAPDLQSLPAYPSITRDMALILDSSVTHANVMSVIQSAAPVELTQIKLFDIFRGGRMGDDRRSLAYSLVYRSTERSLTDEDANGYHETIKAAIRSELEAEIREG